MSGIYGATVESFERGLVVTTPPDWHAVLDCNDDGTWGLPETHGWETPDVSGTSGTFDTFSHYRDEIPRSNLSRVLVAAFTAHFFHECLEFITVDGERVADPHPPKDEQWSWVQQRLEEMVAEYAERWPVQR